MIQLYSAQACPFAQRTRALLQHLSVPFELHEIDLENRDPAFLKLTPTGRVPLLVDGKHVLYESAVINGYLAEQHGLADAFAGDPYVRARERLAMAQWDQVVVPAFYRSMREPASFDDARASVVGELDQLLVTVLATGKRQGGLLSFHCAPFWARMDWLRAESPLATLVDERIMLRGWLDGAVALPAVQATLPDRDATVQRYRERFAGR